MKIQSAGAFFEELRRPFYHFRRRYTILDTSKTWNDFVKYVAFSVLAMLAMSCYILADTFFVSQGLGTSGLAALNLAIPVYNFIHGTGLMLGMAAPPASPSSEASARRGKRTACLPSPCISLPFFLCSLCWLACFFPEPSPAGWAPTLPFLR